MSKKSVTLTTTAAAKVCDVHVPRGKNSWIGTIDINGTMGSGTTNVYISGDGGTTTTGLRTSGGTLLSTGAAIMYSPIEMGGQIGNLTPLAIYAVTTSTNSPSIAVTVYDNN